MSKGGCWGQGEEQRKGVRFRDGRVVSTRGERFIVEQTKEEYDGGSRCRFGRFSRTV